MTQVTSSQALTLTVAGREVSVQIASPSTPLVSKDANTAHISVASKNSAVRPIIERPSETVVLGRQGPPGASAYQFAYAADPTIGSPEHFGSGLATAVHSLEFIQQAEAFVADRQSAIQNLYEETVAASEAAAASEALAAYQSANAKDSADVAEAAALQAGSYVVTIDGGNF